MILDEPLHYIENLDIVFCMDITYSMDPYLDKSLSTIKNIMNEVSARSKHKNIKTRFGFVGYRDHPP